MRMHVGHGVPFSCSWPNVFRRKGSVELACLCWQACSAHAGERVCKQGRVGTQSGCVSVCVFANQREERKAESESVSVCLSVCLSVLWA